MYCPCKINNKICYVYYIKKVENYKKAINIIFKKQGK